MIVRRCLHGVVICAALVAGACDGVTVAKGIVRDVSQRPLGAAEVTLIVPKGVQVPDLTDARGLFAIGVVHAPFGADDLTLQVRREGYVGVSTTLKPYVAYDCSATLAVPNTADKSAIVCAKGDPRPTAATP